MVSSIKWFHATPDNLTITLIKVLLTSQDLVGKLLDDLVDVQIALTNHIIITISSTDGGLSRRPSHPLDPISASLTLWNLLLRCGECPWTGNFLRDKDEELRLRQSYILVWQRNEDLRHREFQCCIRVLHNLFQCSMNT